MKVSLVATQGKAVGKAVPITLAQFIVGRDSGCHLRPASPMVSKRHCAILTKGGRVYVRDFESTNGTLVNDLPLSGETELRDGDKLKIGPLLFMVRIEATASMPALAPGQKPAAPAAAKPAAAPAGAKPAAAAAPKPAAPAAKAPVAAPAPVSEEDEALAAMLLDLEGDPVPPEQAAAAGDSIPTGSTVFEMPAFDANAAKPGEPAKKEAPKKPMGDTSAAAKAILDKYTKRPRG